MKHFTTAINNVNIASFLATAVIIASLIDLIPIFLINTGAYLKTPLCVSTLKLGT
jgi:hypothetical protein